jgi:hypothetical protein
VTRPDGSAVTGAEVKINYNGSSLVWEDAVFADKEGRYEAKNIPASGFRYSWMDPNSEKDGKGKITVAAKDTNSLEPLVAQPQEAEVKPGDSLEKDIRLEKGMLFAGKIIDLTTSRPVPNFQSWIFVNANSTSKHLSTDEKGEFRLVVPPSSRVRVTSDSSRSVNFIVDEKWRQNNHYNLFEGTVSKDMPDQVLKVKLWPARALTGKVVDPKGQPVKGASVLMHSDVPAAKTDAAGLYTIKTIPTDRDIDLFAISGDKSLAGKIHLFMGSTSATIGLVPTASYDGFVKTPKGAPATNLKFYLDLKINDSTIFEARAEPVTNDKGRFAAHYLYPSGTYHAWWSADNNNNRDYDWGNVDVDVSKVAPGGLIEFEAKQ